VSSNELRSSEGVLEGALFSCPVKLITSPSLVARLRSTPYLSWDSAEEIEVVGVRLPVPDAGRVLLDGGRVGSIRSGMESNGEELPAGEVMGATPASALAIPPPLFIILL